MSSGYRFIREDKLQEAAARLVDGTLNLASFHGWVVEQPRLPKLIGTTRAAEVLDVNKSSVRAFADRGELLEVRIDGGHPAYLEDEVRRIAAARKR